MKLNTIFRYCNDVEPMREFYSNVIGLTETYYDNNAKHGWLTYSIGETQLVFIRSQQPQAVGSDFAKHPGYEGGQLENTSWVIEVPLDTFDSVVSKIKKSPFKTFEPELTNNHKMLFVLDPMGFTVEIYSEVIP